MKIHNIEQGTEEWHEVRKGKFTASHAQAIASNGAGLTSYIYDILAKKHSLTTEEGYNNADMERGVELEQQAKDLYELETGNEVENVGFVELDDYVGCSPDGLVGDKGLVEVKCHNNVNHIKLLATKKIETKYQWQMQMQLYVTGREWCDYVAYNPNYEQNFIIIKVDRDKEMIEKLKKGLESGVEKMLKLEESLTIK